MNNNKTIDIGSDFSGVGSFEQALERLGISYNTVFSCDMDKYARQSYSLYFGEPKYYPNNVYDRKIPEKSLDIYMTSPPCQAFSMAGKRKGKDDKRGILFYNSLEFIRTNKPRFFIFENVKGLLSHDKSDSKSEFGKTFSEWVNCLGGKSINGSPILFPYENSVPYYIYWQVLNAKDYGVPQNRERVFIVGVRDDKDNVFRWPKPQRLTKRLKDILETNVDEKYYLSDKTTKRLSKHNRAIGSNGAFRGRNPENPSDISAGVSTEQRLEINNNGLSNTITTVQKDNVVVIGNLKGGKWDKTHEQSGRVYDINGVSPTVHTMGGGNQEPKIAEYIGIGVHPNSKKLEFTGFKDAECPTLLATDYKAPKCIQYSNYRIRRLTPTECFRLMDFNPDFIETVIASGEISDTQLYKQAGNSIVVAVLAEIIKKLEKL